MALTLQKKHNADLQSIITKYNCTHTVFVEVYKELTEQLFKPIYAKELQDPGKVSDIRVKNLDSTANKMSKTNPSLIGLKAKMYFKMYVLFYIIELDKSETYNEEEMLPENGLYLDLY